MFVLLMVHLIQDHIVHKVVYEYETEWIHHIERLFKKAKVDAFFLSIIVYYHVFHYQNRRKQLKK